MDRKNKPNREYNSSRRREQARQTRLQILEAARNLFIDLGYTGATMDSIAAQAGVAVETIYAIFKNKKAILIALMSMSLVGDDDPIPLLKRKGPQGVLAGKDQYLQVQSFAEDMGRIMERVAPLFEVMHGAAKLEPEIADLLQNMLEERASGMQVFIRALRKNGPFKRDQTIEQAADSVWAVTSGEVYDLFVTHRGWSRETYTAWLKDVLTDLLLP